MAEPSHTGKTDSALLALALVLGVIFFVFPLALDHPLLDPDEGLHAAVAQEMVERGDWLVPQLLGEPFRDKPALFTWLQALALRWLGTSEAAVRLPGLLAGLIAVAATGWAAHRLLGPRAAVLAAVFYATLLLPAALSQAATTDTLLVPVVICALVLLWECGQPGDAGRPTGRVLAAGVVLGIGTLAKGLVGIALVGVAYGVYLAVCHWRSRRSNRAASVGEKGVKQRTGRSELLSGLGRLSAPVGIALMVAAPWYLAMEVRNPGYLHYYFIDRHLRGFVTAGQPHGDQPWWYYLPVLFGGGLPWLAWLPAAARHTWAGLRPRAAAPQTCESSDARVLGAHGPESPADRAVYTSAGDSAGQPPRAEPIDGMLLAWCWLVGDVLLLSLGRSKLATYLWPVFPAIAILAAGVWAAALDGQATEAVRRAVRRTMLLTACLTPGALPLVMWIVGSLYGLQFAWPTWGLAVATSATAWTGVWYVRRRALRCAIAAVSLSLGAQFVVAMVCVVPLVAEEVSARCLAEHFNRQGSLPVRLLMVDQRVGSIVFYLDPALRARLDPETIRRVRISRLPRPEPGVLVAVAERDLARVGHWVHLEGVPYETAGGFRLYEAQALVRRDQGP